MGDLEAVPRSGASCAIREGCIFGFLRPQGNRLGVRTKIREADSHEPNAGTTGQFVTATLTWLPRRLPATLTVQAGSLDCFLDKGVGSLDRLLPVTGQNSALRAVWPLFVCSVSQSSKLFFDALVKT